MFRLASDPIDDHHGEVYQYVGDEIVITWTVADGRDHARPLACFFAIQQALEGAAPDFEREFGAVPRLRAALHAGPVIAGEVGGSRRAIVYHGDVMNTTSRLEQATRDLDRQFLVSGDALDRLDAVGAYPLEDLGLQQLRGRAAPVHVYAVAAKQQMLYACGQSARIMREPDSHPQPSPLPLRGRGSRCGSLAPSGGEGRVGGRAGRGKRAFMNRSDQAA